MSYISLDGLDYTERLAKIIEYKDTGIVFHYICSNCDSEEVTDVYEFTSLEDLEAYITDYEQEDNELMVRLECHNCGSVELFIPILELQGFETDF